VKAVVPICVCVYSVYVYVFTLPRKRFCVYVSVYIHREFTSVMYFDLR
jgi:hypothetical protein